MDYSSIPVFLSQQKFIFGQRDPERFGFC